MPEPDKTELPICCGAARCAGRKQYTYDPVRPTVREFLAMGRTSSGAEKPIEQDDPAPTDNSQRCSYARHEVGHVLVAHELNYFLAGVTLAPPTAYVFPPDGVGIAEQVAVHLAGIITDRWLHNRLINRPDAAHWAFFIDAARRGDGGSCDECRAAQAVLEVFPAAADDEIVDHIRRGEQLAIDIMTRDAMTEIAAALADELITKTTIGAAALYSTIEHLRGNLWV